MTLISSAEAKDFGRWAASLGIEHAIPSAEPTPIDAANIPVMHPFEDSVEVDFARTEVETPSLVLRPTSVDALRRVLERAAESKVSVTTRGAGHSSGGQSLTRGLQLDLKGLDRAELVGEHVHAQAGCRWKAVLRACAPSGRRPSVLIGSQEPTVGGTLSVGGFGDRTPRAGLQIDQVESMTVALIGGELREVLPGDLLFDYVLAGRGQLAVIVDVVFRTCPLPDVMDVRGLHFPSLEGFWRTARAELEQPRWDGMPAWWDIATDAVDVLVGRASDAFAMPAVDVPNSSDFEASDDIERVPVLAALEMDERVGTAFAAPCLEVVCALKDAPRIMPMFRAALLELGLAPYLPEGVPLAMFRRNPARPLSPAPEHDDLAVIAAARPEMPGVVAQRVLPSLRALADALMGAGASLYLMSVEGSRPDFLERQWGEAKAEKLVEAKRAHDPLGLLNPWVPMKGRL